MYKPIFELASFESLPLEDRKHLIGVGCEFLIAVNRMWLKRNPSTPKFYQLKPAYALKVRPFGIDRWQDIPQTIALREGDCKDFVCYRVAQMREEGNPDCGPYILASQANGIISYHVQVRNGLEMEDPSAAMGMPKNLTPDQLKKLFTNGTEDAQAVLAMGTPQGRPNTPGLSPHPGEIQHLLGCVGCQPPVMVTGAYDMATARAVASFQKRLGMKPTGHADAGTVHNLRVLARRAQRTSGGDYSMAAGLMTG